MSVCYLCLSVCLSACLPVCLCVCMYVFSQLPQIYMFPNFTYEKLLNYKHFMCVCVSVYILYQSSVGELGRVLQAVPVKLTQLILQIGRPS